MSRSSVRFKGVESGLKVRGALSDLSPAQKAVYHMIVNEHETPRKVALRRKTSVQAVYKILSILRKKGVLGPGFKGVENMEATLKPPGTIRLHAQRFRILILWKDQRYDKIRKSGNLDIIDSSTVQLHKGAVEIHSGVSFFGSDAYKATAESMHYWHRFITRLENQLKVILLKPRKTNLTLVYAHYAEVGSEAARFAEDRGERIKVFSTEDGKLWFTIDNSFHLREAETLHPESAERDMQEVVSKQMNDWRDHDPPTLSELMKLLDLLVTENVKTAATVKAMVKLKEREMRPRESVDVNGRLSGKPEYIG